MIVTWAVLAFPSSAWAQQMSPEVLEIAEEGRRLFDEGEYRRAISLLGDGYEQHHQPIFLQYIGRCHEELDEPCEAADHYRRFLETGDLSGEIRQELEVRTEDLQERCDELTEEPDEPDERVGPPPEGPPRDFGNGSEPELVSHRGTDIAGITLMGLAGASLIAGVALWGVAYGMAEPQPPQQERRCPTDGPCHPISIAGDVLLFGVTSALLTIGAIVFGVGRRNAREENRSQVSLVPGPGGLSLSLAWR